MIFQHEKRIKTTSDFQYQQCPYKQTRNQCFYFYLFHRGQKKKKNQKLNKDQKNPEKKSGLLMDNLWRETCWIHWKQGEPLYVISQLWSAENEIHCHPPFLALECNFTFLNDLCVGHFTRYPIAWHNQLWLPLVDDANPNSHQGRLTQGNTVKDSRNFFLMSPSLRKKTH